MPLYEYKCTKCSHIFEKQQKITDASIKKCPKCRGAVNKIFSASGIIFKGSGFHNTDYRKDHNKPAKPEPVKEAAKSTVNAPAKKETKK